MNKDRILEQRKEQKNKLKHIDMACPKCGKFLYMNSNGYICLNCRFRKLI